MDSFSGPALSATAILLAGCAVMSGPQPEGPPSNRDEEAVMDPVGVYDVTMSSQSHVSEGTIEIRGKPGRYHGFMQLGSVSAVLERVEPGAGILHLRVKLPGGTLVLRLTGDGRSFSGNWVLETQRGTVTAGKRGVAKGESGSAGRNRKQPVDKIPPAFERRCIRAGRFALPIHDVKKTLHYVNHSIHSVTPTLRSALLLGRIALLFTFRRALPARRLAALGARSALSTDR